MEDPSFKAAIEDIKRRLSIVEVIEDVVSLKRSGKNLVGLCPFHDDKNPSMHVNEDKGFFHCFSCGAGGDVFGFLMRHGGMEFMDAMRELAPRAGVEIPSGRKRGRKSDEGRSDRKRLLEINSLVCSMYRELYRAGRSSAAREYAESRGIGSETAAEFELGFAPDGWTTVVDFARKKKIATDDLKRLGLVAERKSKKGHYDLFRDRLIFPIRGLDGSVVGFGGRTLASGKPDSPKYLNSSESPVFSKKGVLYGLYHSRTEIRKNRRAILVEGYMDLVKLWEAGVRNVAATLGTAFTGEHATILRRLCEEVVIVYDGDAAGVSSAARAGEIMLERGVSSRICRIPDGLDPDDYMEKHGPRGFAELLENSVAVSDFVIDDAFSMYGKKKMSASEVTRFLAELVSKIKDPIERAGALAKITGIFGIRESELLSMIRSANSGRNRGSLSPRARVSDDSAVERMIVKILLRFPRLASAAEIGNIGDHFENGDLKVIFERASELGFDDASSLISSFENVETQELLSGLIFSSDELMDESTSEKILRDCVIKLELRRMSFRLGEVRGEIQKQRSSPDKELERKLVRRYRDLDREYRDLEKSMRGNIS